MKQANQTKALKTLLPSFQDFNINEACELASNDFLKFFDESQCEQAHLADNDADWQMFHACVMRKFCQ